MHAYVGDDGFALIPVNNQRLSQVLWICVKDLLDLSDGGGLDGCFRIQDELCARVDGSTAQIVYNVRDLLVRGCLALCLDEIDFEVVVDRGLFEESESLD